MDAENLKKEIDLRMNLDRFEKKIFDLLGGNFAGIKKREFVEKLLTIRKQFLFYYEENTPLSLDDLMEYPMMMAYKNASSKICHYRVECAPSQVNPEKKLWKVSGSYENRWFTSLPALVSFYRNWHVIPMKGNSGGDLFPMLENYRNED